MAALPSFWFWRILVVVTACSFLGLENRNPSFSCATRFGITATIAHYPTGASKWNPIEHRLFSEISKHWAAEPLVSYEKMLGFIRNTSTKTGLVVTAYLDRNEYPTGLKPDPHSFPRSLSNPAKYYRDGTIPFDLICEVIFAATLSARRGGLGALGVLVVCYTS